MQRHAHCSNQGEQQEKSTWQREDLALRLHWSSTQPKLADQQGCEITLTSHPHKTEFFHLLPPPLPLMLHLAPASF